MPVTLPRLGDIIPHILEQGALLARNMLMDASITQQFGPTTFGAEPSYRDPRTGTLYPHFHAGIDLAWNGNTRHDIYSVSDGTVIQTGWIGGFGNGIRIRASNGDVVTYGHLSAGTTLVAPGQPVQVGTKLGIEGSTGNSTGPHLHLQIQDPQGRFINPLTGGYDYSHGYPAQAVSALFNLFSWDGTPRPGPTPQPGGDPGGGTNGGGTNGGGTGQGIDPGQILGMVLNPTSALGPLSEKFRQDIVPPLALLTAGLIFAVAGITKMGKEAPVQAVTGPVVGAGRGAARTARKAGALAASVAAPEAAPVIQAGEKAKESEDKAKDEKREEEKKEEEPKQEDTTKEE